MYNTVTRSPHPCGITPLEARGNTENVTGETLVLNKNFPSIKQGFSPHYAEKVGKIGFVLA